MRHLRQTSDLTERQAAPLMSHPNLPQSVWQFLIRLCQHPAIDVLVLFGSRAAGDHDERSDADVAVCGPAISRLEWARMKDAAAVARSLYRISLVHYDRNPDPLRKRIDSTGTVIYVRAKATR